MGEHLPCKQGVKGSNPFISIRVLTKTESLLISESCQNGGIKQAGDHKAEALWPSVTLYLENCILKISKKHENVKTSEVRHEKCQTKS